jgi:hypothetical protein
MFRRESDHIIVWFTSTHAIRGTPMPRCTRYDFMVVGEWHVKEPWQQMLLSNSSSRVVDDVSLQSRTLLHRSNIPFLTCGNKSIRQYIYLSTIRPDIFLIYMFKYNVLWLVVPSSFIITSTIVTVRCRTTAKK